MIVLGVIGGVVWLLLSPTFSVAELEVTGVQSSDTAEVLVDHRVTEGRPMILIRTGAIESTLLRDPWVERAEVALDWPRRVVVSIVERVPAAWVETSEGWARRAVDGVALPGASEPDETMPHIVLPAVGSASAESDPLVLGALEFVDALPVALGSNSVVDVRSGELWAVVAGFQVRLGRPTEMSDKALSLAALIAEDPAPGSVINVIAPTNPAVTPPTTVGEQGSGEQGDTGEESGSTNPEP